MKPTRSILSNVLSPLDHPLSLPPAHSSGHLSAPPPSQGPPSQWTTRYSDSSRRISPSRFLGIRFHIWTTLCGSVSAHASGFFSALPPSRCPMAYLSSERHAIAAPARFSPVDSTKSPHAWTTLCGTSSAYASGPSSALPTSLAPCSVPS